MSRVLIFGISGFVGSYLAEEFHNACYDVYGSDIIEKACNHNTKFTKADLLDAKSVASVIFKIKPDIIINLASISNVGFSWKLPQSTMTVNVIGSLNILEAARQLRKPPKVMLIGSSEEYEIYDEPINEKVILNANNPYGVSKITQELFAKLYRDHYDVKVYCVRPFNHSGIGQKEDFVLPSFCKQVAEIEKSGKSGIIKVGNLLPKRDFSHVKDIVKAYRMIIEDNDCTTIYNVGSGKAYGLNEILDYIISLCHQNVTVEIDPDKFRPVDTPIICCDNSLIKLKLGWEPKYSVYDILKELYMSYL